ncbi:NAD(P) transhydrogenase subunit alpha [Curtobacterium sp. VKM Ac-1393]|uniref:NAD(P) transhydrogenase subunit alpha n=1 Tax=Curtobacterium sp. VKM Ac-1393 TaxID=2783814 RepID=UPI00188BDD14|nr:NAD(P) transhydrogenase subunit alpha [Curtobacterium sp. VKM Ac-1393]MBF4606901.1 NAD(P) transhydrogenase subunit alpha [Curtobacterium sp. VKM Ac-1393]
MTDRTEGPPVRPHPITIGVLRETAVREQRVALDPEVSALLVAAGFQVCIEHDAGVAASCTDAEYTAAGATVTARDEVLQRGDVIAVVRPPDSLLAAMLRTGQTLIGLVDPLAHPELMRQLADAHVDVLSFELLPRTLSRAQAMDAVSSQASTAGYRAAIVAAAAFERYFPMMITASGTARPARVLVIGAGVAGLQAIGTAKRLGAVVTGYDVRPASRGEVESLGATFLTSSITAGGGSGGYARPLSAEESVAQQAELADHLTRFDVIITTAKVPGRTPPLLVTAATLAALEPGSVCVDLAATAHRGNVAGTVDGTTTRTATGVIVIGAGSLSSELATSSSHMYARNVHALLSLVCPDGVVSIDLRDEVQRAVVVCRDGAVVNEAVRTAETTVIA